MTRIGYGHTTFKGEKKTFTRDDKINAAGVYVVNGTAVAAAKAVGCARQTVDQWLNSGDQDFAEALQAAREAYDASIPHRLAAAMDGALAQIVKKLPEADARASATIYGILFDKRQISSGKATSISSKSEDIDKRLNDIGAKLENMAERHRRTTVKAV